MSQLLKPRDYQEECIADLTMRRDRGDNHVPSVLATGLGKTVIFSHHIVRWLATADAIGKRAMVVVDTDELVGQTVKKIKDVAPLVRVGVVKAGRNEVTARVIVASAQTIQRRARRSQIRNLGLGIIDECDVAPKRTKSIMDDFPDAFWCGFTATLARADKQKLSDVWSQCTFKRGIAFGIRRGYLLDVRGKRVVIPDMDLRNVKKSGGDYQDSALADEMMRTLAPTKIAEAYVEHASDRKGIAYWPLVTTAGYGAAAFEHAGIPSAVVVGTTPLEERRLILKKLHTGEIQVVHTVGVLDRGFDEPTISCVVMACPTRSKVRYQQRAGRGLRPNLELPPEQRGHCLILDVDGGNRHDLRTLIDLSERAPEDLEMEENESLLELEEALDALEEAGEELPEELYTGEITLVDFDPLARTGIGAWLQTTAGTYFLPVGKEAYVLIVPSAEPAQWDVAWLTQSPNGFLHTGCPRRAAYVTAFRSCDCGGGHQGGQGDLTEHTGLSLDMAVSWAEEVLEELGGEHALMEAGARERWRKAEVSYPWKKLCVKHSIEIKRGWKRGDVHDAVSKKLGSARIDPVVGFMQAMQQGVSEGMEDE